MESQDHPNVVVQPKSAGISIILTILFGPVGLFYASVTGGLVMTVATFLLSLMTFGLAFFIMWPITIIWGAVAVSEYNSKLHNLPNTENNNHTPQKSAETEFKFNSSKDNKNASGIDYDFIDKPLRSNLEIDKTIKATLESKMKKCPMCFEEIKYLAKKCKHCQYVIDENKYNEVLKGKVLELRTKYKKENENIAHNAIKFTQKHLSSNAVNKKIKKHFKDNYEISHYLPYVGYFIIKKGDKNYLGYIHRFGEYKGIVNKESPLYTQEVKNWLEKNGIHVE